MDNEKKKIREKNEKNQGQFWMNLEALLKEYGPDDSIVIIKISDSGDRMTNNHIMTSMEARHLVVFSQLAKEIIERQVDSIADENPRIAAKIMAQLILSEQMELTDEDEENAGE